VLTRSKFRKGSLERLVRHILFHVIIREVQRKLKEGDYKVVDGVEVVEVDLRRILKRSELEVK
jgi:hypothetical protein